MNGVLCDRCRWLMSAPTFKAYEPRDVREYHVRKGSEYMPRQHLCLTHVKLLRESGISVVDAATGQSI